MIADVSDAQLIAASIAIGLFIICFGIFLAWRIDVFHQAYRKKKFNDFVKSIKENSEGRSK